MSLIQPSISRDAVIEKSPAGKWHYTIKEGETSFYTSHTFLDHDSCLEDAISFLDMLHEEQSLRSNTGMPGDIT